MWFRDFLRLMHFEWMYMYYFATYIFYVPLNLI